MEKEKKELDYNARRAARKKALLKKKRRRKIIIIVALVLVILLGIFIFVAAKFGLINRLGFKDENLEVNAGLTGKTGYTTWAMFGIDSRDTGSLDKGSRSDTMIIVSINNETKEVKMASVFRDTYLDIANKNSQDFYKANQAYFLGGPEQAVSMLNKNLDLQITDYVTVDFKAIATAVNEVGGIDLEMTAEEAEWANLYALDVREHTGMDFKAIPETAGVHHCDGVVATGYARVRYTAGDDFKRAERQRTVIAKLVEKAKKTNIFALNSLVDKMLPLCATSLSNSEILTLARNVGEFNMGENMGFPIDQKTKVMSGPGDCVIPLGLAQNVSQLHEFLYGEEGYEPTQTVKQISDKIVKATGYTAPEDSKSSTASTKSSSSKSGTASTNKKTTN